MAIQKIFVVGAGLMGSGIAQTAIVNGYDVVLNDQRQEALERAQMGIQKALEREVEKGRMTQEAMDVALPRLALDITIEGAKDADLVIEAVFENLEAKQTVFQQLEEVCPPHTVIVGSNLGSVEDMDNGMKLGCNHPMGPLELADMIGLDILLNVMNVLSKEYGEKYHPSMILRKMVTAGFLGRKSGAGFYIYENGKKVGVNPVLVQQHSLEQ